MSIVINNYITILKNVVLYSDIKTLIYLSIIDGKIEAIEPYQKSLEEQWGHNHHVIDGKGAVILPGMIDAHTHMRDLNLAHKEDFYTASKACAHGGITTFIDMPNTNPPTVSIKALMEKRKLAQEKAFINFGFHFGASVLDNTDEINKVKNVASIKVYLNETTGNLYIEDDVLLLSIFKKAPLMLSFHAEGTELMQKCFDFALQTGKSIYFCHVSLMEELELLLKLKQEIKEKKYPFSLYIEVAPHHLMFSLDDMKEKNAQLLHMKPPLKSKKDNQFLMDALSQGLIDTIGTDHAPHLLEEKMAKVTYGVPCVEAALPFLLDLVSKNIISLEYIVRLYSKNPADIFKIKNKGSLKVGYDADFVLVDLNQQTVLTKENIQSKCGWSLFENTPLQGKVLETWVNGVCVYSSYTETYQKIKAKEVSFD